MTFADTLRPRRGLAWSGATRLACMDRVNPEDVPPELLEGMRQYLDFEGIEQGRLVRVIAIGQTVEASDVRVDLIAMEVRETGAFLYWRALAGQDRWLGDIQLAIADDLGTVYRTMTKESGGGGREFSGQIAVIPAPPSSTQVQIAVRGFKAFLDHYPPGPRTPVTGHWDFGFRSDNADASPPP